MKNLIGLLSLLLVLSACRTGDELYAFEAIDDKNLSWAFIQFYVPEDNGETETYYLYGQVSKNLLNKVASNQIEHGFIFMKNVRYWGENDTIREYRDGENTGDLVYRIEDIRRVKMIRTEPKVGMGYEQFEKQENESEEKKPAASKSKADNKL